MSTQPDGRADQAPPSPRGRRRQAVRWIAHGVLLVALAVGIFGLLPRLGGLTREAAGLRHARPAFLVAAVVAQAISLGCYAQLYRQVLGALGARIRFRLAADVILATFFVSHLTPFGSATGTLVNASALEADGVAATTTGEAIGLTSLTSAVALIVLFGTGFVATAGRHVSHQYLVIAGVAFFLVVAALAVLLAVGAHPAIAGRAGHWAASVAKHVRPSIDPDQVGQTSSRLASLARSALTGRAFVVSFGFASGDLLFDLLSLDLVFLALRYQPGFGPLAVAYAAANIASAIPLTPGGLGVIEVTLVAITVGFGAPRATAVLAVLGYRIVNYWLPLLPGAIAYLRLRLRRGADGQKKPATGRSSGVPVGSNPLFRYAWHQWRNSSWLLAIRDLFGCSDRHDHRTPRHVPGQRRPRRLSDAMQTMPGQPRGPSRFARALGLDRNPLRRASDRAEAWIRIGLLAVFLIAGPMAALAAGGWAYHAGITAARGHAAPSQHVETAAPQPTVTPTHPAGLGPAWAGTRWASTTSSARSGEVLAAVMTLALTALATLAVLRLSVAILRRRRLAAWEVAWSRVGPQWSRGKP